MRHIKHFEDYPDNNYNIDILVEMMQKEFPGYEVETNNYTGRLWIELTENGKDVASYSIAYFPFLVKGWIEAINALVVPNYRNQGISQRAFKVLNDFVKLSGYNGIYSPKYTEDSDFERSPLGEALWASLEKKGLARSETKNDPDDPDGPEKTYYYIGK
jgi:GNAT superfamily N-acetyltransferase